MKYRNKNYISMGTFWFFLIIINSLTVLATYLVCDSFPHEPPHRYALSDPDTARYELPVDTPEFQTGDQARFNFTGDTVLVLSQNQSLNEDEIRVLYKSPQGSFQTVDLPDNWLVKIPNDPVPMQKPVPPTDKLERHRKAVAK